MAIRCGQCHLPMTAAEARQASCPACGAPLEHGPLKTAADTPGLAEAAPGRVCVVCGQSECDRSILVRVQGSIREGRLIRKNWLDLRMNACRPCFRRVLALQLAQYFFVLLVIVCGVGMALPLLLVGRRSDVPAGPGYLVLLAAGAILALIACAIRSARIGIMDQSPSNDALMDLRHAFQRKTGQTHPFLIPLVIGGERPTQPSASQNP